MGKSAKETERCVSREGRIPVTYQCAVLNEYCHRSGLATELSTTEQCNAAVTWYVETRTLTDASGNYTQLLEAFRPTSGCIWFSKRLSGRDLEDLPGQNSSPAVRPGSLKYVQELH